MNGPKLYIATPAIPVKGLEGFTRYDLILMRYYCHRGGSPQRKLSRYYGDRTVGEK